MTQHTVTSSSECNQGFLHLWRKRRTWLRSLGPFKNCFQRRANVLQYDLSSSCAKSLKPCLNDPIYFLQAKHSRGSRKNVFILLRRKLFMKVLLVIDYQTIWIFMSTVGIPKMRFLHPCKILIWGKWKDIQSTNLIKYSYIHRLTENILLIPEEGLPWYTSRTQCNKHYASRLKISESFFLSLEAERELWVEQKHRGP